MHESTSCRIEAGAIVVSSQEMIAPGQIVVRNGKIVEVTTSLSEPPDAQLHDCVLLPGLINSHTHLEFSDLVEPLPAGEHFPEWIQNVLAQRQQASTSDVSRSAAISTGLRESLAAGVVAVGDIVTPPWHPQPYLAAEIKLESTVQDLADEESIVRLHAHLVDQRQLPSVIAFIEQLGLSPARQQSLLNWRKEVVNVDKASWPARLAELAFSPHAPYSTPFELIQELSQQAQLQHRQLAMHLLESPAERQWIDTGIGPMAGMLEQFGVTGWRLPSDYIQQLCRCLSQAKSALIIHGNYLTDAELDCIAGYDNLSIVYCPRTHAHFGHQAYPLKAIQQRGIRWLLGTDSRSTNPDLNLWTEFRTAIERHSGLRPVEAFSAVTDSAAAGMGIEKDFGSLRPGCRAAINYVRLPTKVPSDFEQLLELMMASDLAPRLLF